MISLSLRSPASSPSKCETYPQMAVSVDMLTTGFDCRELLHLAMCRRVRSAILYQQIRGHGTRVAPHIGQRCFVIYDFFKNHEHFNDSDIDIFTGTGSGRGTGGGTTPRNHPGNSLSWAWKMSGSMLSITLRSDRRVSGSTNANT